MLDDKPKELRRLSVIILLISLGLAAAILALVFFSL